MLRTEPTKKLFVTHRWCLQKKFEPKIVSEPNIIFGTIFSAQIFFYFLHFCQAFKFQLLKLDELASVLLNLATPPHSDPGKFVVLSCRWLNERREVQPLAGHYSELHTLVTVSNDSCVVAPIQYSMSVCLLFPGRTKSQLTTDSIIG